MIVLGIIMMAISAAGVLLLGFSLFLDNPRINDPEYGFTQYLGALIIAFGVYLIGLFFTIFHISASVPS